MSLVSVADSISSGGAANDEGDTPKLEEYIEIFLSILISLNLQRRRKTNSKRYSRSTKIKYGFASGKMGSVIMVNMAQKDVWLRPSICYYTFWSGVADLSARLPEGACASGGRADKPQHHDKRCLLQVARWFGVISWQRSRKRVFSRARSVYWSVHFQLCERFSMTASSSSFLRVF